MECGMWDLSSLTRNQTYAPAVEVQSLNHWTTREVPFVAYFIPNSFCLLVPSLFF